MHWTGWVNWPPDVSTGRHFLTGGRPWERGEMVRRHVRAPASTQELTVSVTAGRDLASMRAQLREWLPTRVGAAAVDEILLATGEAMANALEHGQPPVTMQLSWADQRLAITIHDSGSWRVAPDGGSRGLGLPIMSSLMDDVTVDTADGTRVVLRRQFG